MVGGRHHDRQHRDDQQRGDNLCRRLVTGDLAEANQDPHGDQSRADEMQDPADGKHRQGQRKEFDRTAQYPQAEDHERRTHCGGTEVISAAQHPQREPYVEARADAQKDC